MILVLKICVRLKANVHSNNQPGKKIMVKKIGQKYFVDLLSAKSNNQTVFSSLPHGELRKALGFKIDL